MSLHVEGGGEVSVPRALMQAFLQQDPNHPGLETVRLPLSSPSTDGGTGEGPVGTSLSNSIQPVTTIQHCREIESELCLVCRRCGRAYPQESSLLAHQRSCYLGNQQRRGALRLVQMRYACTLCGDDKITPSIAEWRRHADSSHHRSKLEASNAANRSLQTSDRIGIGIEFGTGQGEEEQADPQLTDEMEDVVNQITLLAARAAAESITTTTTNNSVVNNCGNNQDNNNIGIDNGNKRQKIIQEANAVAVAAAVKTAGVQTGAAR